MKYLILEVPEAVGEKDVTELAALMSEFPCRWWIGDAAIVGTVENIRLLKETLDLDSVASNFDAELRMDVANALEDCQMLFGEEVKYDQMGRDDVQHDGGEPSAGGPGVQGVVPIGESVVDKVPQDNWREPFQVLPESL